MSELKEYVVTLKSKDDLDGFYDDMETPGGDLYIPDRAVELVNRRPNSRNTHYMLSDDEAETLRADARVMSVELTPSRLGLVIKPAYDQSSDFWVKSSANTATHVNWGLLRVVEGVQRTNWGSDSDTTESGSIKINSAGRNVDIVVVDGHINPSHPEYAVNADGTGGSRVVQYNWFQHNTTVLGTANSTYVYTPYVDGGNANRTDDNDHGAHVAGTVAGNTQGWARAANIYNINPYSTNVNTYDALYIFDYIRAFHNSKPVNPNTGRKNPTIVNNSWGYFYEISIADISQVNYRGNVVLSGETVTQANLNTYGVLNDGVTSVVPARYYALDADVSDAIDDGIVVVGAAGNNSFKIDVAGGVDIDNYFIFSSGASNFAAYYHEGSSPGSSTGAITVGSISTLADERKSSFSNCGPRIDIYAPGSQIMSSINSTGIGVADSRNSSYNLIKYSGTSMASPQVAGVLACMMEIYPGMTQTQALDYIVSKSKSGQMTDTAGGYTDLASLQASNNRYLYYSRERPISGQSWPKVNFFVRPTVGVTYPRFRIRK